MSYIVYQNPITNCMEITYPCINDIEIVKKSIPKDNNGETVNYKFIENFPKLIESYNFVDNEIVRDRNKLHEIKKKEWRMLRKPKLEKLDIEFMKSLEDNDVSKQEEIKLKKQQLRDVTSISIDNLSNDELEEYIPEILI